MGMDVYGKKPDSEAGKYFRASIWSWRPIHAMCERVLAKRLPWSSNDGRGFSTQRECNDLADKLEEFLVDVSDEELTVESELRVNDSGMFLPKGSSGGKSAYYTDKEHVQQFIEFLRHCGGFEIC